MEILRFILNFLLKNYNDGSIADIFKLLEENSFDIKRVLQNASPETLEPIFKKLFSVFSKGQKESPKDYNFESYGLKPIINIADKEIVYALNKYFAD